MYNLKRCLQQLFHPGMRLASQFSHGGGIAPLHSLVASCCTEGNPQYAYSRTSDNTNQGTTEVGRCSHCWGALGRLQGIPNGAAGAVSVPRFPHGDRLRLPREAAAFLLMECSTRGAAARRGSLAFYELSGVMRSMSRHRF